MRAILLHGLFALLTLGACVPARVPDQLAATAGPALVIDSEWVHGPAFSLRNPAGWRVITGEAGGPQRLILAAPDGLTTIEVQVGEAQTPTDQPPPQALQVLPLGSTQVTATLRTPPEQQAAMQAVFERVIASVRR